MNKMETHEDVKKRLGLPKETPTEEVAACYAVMRPIRHFKPDETESFRLTRAVSYGLPESATWTDIIQAMAEYGRKWAAKELGISENSTWKEISQIVLRKEKENGGKWHDITIIVNRNLGVGAHKMGWEEILTHLKYFGINTDGNDYVAMSPERPITVETSSEEKYSYPNGLSLTVGHFKRITEKPDNEK